MGMNQGNEIDVRISAETSALKPGMEGAANDVEKSADRMKGAVSRLQEDIGGHFAKITNTVKASNDDIGGSLAKMSGAFGKVGALIGTAFAAIAGGYLAKAAADTANYTEEAMTLGRAMGTTATQASIWMEVAKEVGSSTGEVEGASKGLTRQLKENEDRLNALGLVTRDGNGNLLDMDTLMKGAIKTVNSYKEGTDRNMAAQEIFGRSVAGNSKLLLANAEETKETEKYIRSLGGQVSEEGVAAWTLYDAAMDKVGMGMTAFRNVIGNEVMPVIAKLAEWFSKLMPTAITVAKVAIGSLASAFWVVKNGVVVVWETINAMVVSVAEPIRALSAAIGKALTGDFDGAAAELKGIGGVISSTWSQAMDEMSKSSEETATRIGAIFGAPTDVKKVDDDGKSYTGNKDKNKKEKKAPAEKSQMPTWEAELAREKAAYMERNDMYEMSLDLEKQYWDDKLAILNKGDKEYGAVEKKSADLRLKILKQAATEGRGLAQEEVEEKKRLSLAGVEFKQQAAEQEYALGQISYGQMLALDRQFEQERYEIARVAIEERIALLAKDPNLDPVAYQKLQNQLLDVDRKHAIDKKALENAINLDKSKPMTKVFDTMKQSFSSALTGMLTGAMTWRQALQSIFSNVLNSFVQNMVTPMIMRWATGLLEQTSLYQAFFGVKQGLESTAATTTMTTKATEATAVVGSNAAEAASGAAASQASIPYAGWAMAGAAFAAVMAMVMGAKGSIKSAAGGYDVPAGINPVTQIHEEEMVLPAQYANVLRGMAAGNGGGKSGGNTINIHVKSATPKDMIRSLKDGGAAHKVLKDLHRSFAS